MKKIILICGMLISTLSFGADWVYVGSSKVGDKFYIDFDYYNYDKINNKTRLWYKVEEKRNGEYYTEQKTLAEYYCGRGQSKVLSAVYYHPNGEVRKNFESNYLSQPMVVVPDTTGEQIYSVACGTPGKGLDFKDKSIDEMDNFEEYKRARFAYMREKMPVDYTKNLVPSLNIKNYSNYNEFAHDERKEMNKIRERNINNFK